MAMWQVSRWQKEEHPCLAGGGGVARGGRKKGES